MADKKLKCAVEAFVELGNEDLKDLNELEQIGLCWGSIYDQDELKGNLAEFLDIFIHKYNDV